VFTARYDLSPYIKQIRLAFKGQSRIIRLQWSLDSTQSSVCEHTMGLVKGKLHLGSVFETADVQVTYSVLSHRSGTCPQWRTDVTCNTACVHQGAVTFSLLGEAAKLWKAASTFVTSVSPHGTIQLPPDGFSWNLVLEVFSKISWENSIFVKISQE
jgi:hypothetical protein